jgi:endonuclease III
MVDEKQIKSIGQRLVEQSTDDYFGTSHLNESFMTGKVNSIAEAEFKEKANSLIRNMDQYSHAFVLACLMDTGVDADVAWAIPYRVQQYKDVPSFKIEDLYAMPLSRYEAMFKDGKNWHRYPAAKAKVFCEGVRKICDSELMKGDASKIWANKPSSKDVVLRFSEFHGCGFKIANMAANLLYGYFGIEFSDYSFIDIAPDVHTMRVFQRLGLTPTFKNTEIAKIYTICKARELHPEFPGVVDGLCWKVGRNYCKPRNPKCKDCPFNDFCDTYNK